MTGKIPPTIIKRHTYTAAFGGRELGPMTAFPVFRINGRVLEANVRNEYVTPETALLAGRTALITITVGDILSALELAADFAVGDDIFAAGRRKVLDFVPENHNGSSPVKIWRFPAACLLAEMKYQPERGRDQGVELSFAAFPDSSGRLYQLIDR